MKLIPENFLGKSYEELKNFLVLKKYDLNYFKNNKNNSNIFDEAILLSGNLNLLGIETKDSIFSFFDDECRHIKTFLNLEEIRKISLLLLKDSSESFRYFSKEDIKNLEAKFDTEIKEGEFTHFEIKKIEFDNSISFDVNNIENYEIISANLFNYRLIMDLKQSLDLKEKYISVDIFKIEK